MCKPKQIQKAKFVYKSGNHDGVKYELCRIEINGKKSDFVSVTGKNAPFLYYDGRLFTGFPKKTWQGTMKSEFLDKVIEIKTLDEEAQGQTVVNITQEEENV